MKKYEYKSIIIGGFLASGTYEHRQIIDEYAAKGYKYVGYIPTNITPHGKIIEMDLVFEIE